MRCGALVIVWVLWPAAAFGEDRTLTGVSPDVTRYRVGKTTVCDLGAPPSCVELSARRQTKLKLRKPKQGPPQRTAKTAGGRTIEVRIARAEKAAGCLTTKEDPGGCEDPGFELAPRLEVVARDSDGREVELVSDLRDQVLRDGPPDHLPGTILHVVFSKDATRVVVAYQSSELVVVGWDLADRLTATAAPP